MKQNQIAVLVRRGAANLASNSSIAMSRFGVRPAAVCAVMVVCLTSAQAGEVLPAQEPDRQPPPIQKPAYVPQGAQMQRYKAFVRQAQLPLITVTSNILIKVDGTVKLDVTRLGQFRSEDLEALAGQFGVPAGVIGQVTQSIANGSPPSAGQLVRELRRAVIDYRFLQREWERYSPPTEGRATRHDALAALHAGDINQAWELYDGLRKPQAPAIGAPAPPTNLRVVAGP